MRQSPGYESRNQDEVYRLTLSLYGLKQVARVWNKRIDEVLKAMEFHTMKADECLYIRETADTYCFFFSGCCLSETIKTMIGPSSQYCFILIYVDDIIVHPRKKSDRKKFCRP